MSQVGSSRARLSRRLVHVARVVGGAAVLALVLSIAPLLMQIQSDLGVSGWSVRSALACGLGATPTMLANGDPALLYAIPPSVNIPIDQPLGIFALTYAAGNTVNFAEDFSNIPGAPAPSTLGWRWSFGDGSAASAQTQTGSSFKWPSHTFAKAGRYAVRSQIYDPTTSTWVDFDSAWIDVAPASLPNPPVARATATVTAVQIGHTISFDAAGSHAVVGSQLTYQWNFNDASTADGSRATHEFDIPGKGFVALIVTDSRGARSVARINIAVVQNQSQIPTANLTSATASPAVGQSVAFDASASAPDSQGDSLVQYIWDFGDGTNATTQTAMTTHVYARAGAYRVAVQAVDNQGTPAQAVINVLVGAVGSSTAQSGPVQAAVARWLPYGLGALLVLLLAGGVFWVVRGQMRQARLEHERAAMLELHRAKHIPRAGVRPGDPRWGEPREGSRTSGANRPPKR
jgi:PKD repeat protein